MYASVENSYYCSFSACHFSLALLYGDCVNIFVFLLAYLDYLDVFLNVMFEFFSEAAYCKT